MPVCRAAAASPPPRALAPVPDNSSPTGTSGHFHMELLLQGVGTDWRPGPCRPGISPGPTCGEDLMPNHQGFLGPRDPRSIFFLLRVLIIRAHTWSPRTSLLLWAKSSLSPSSAHKAGSGLDLQLPGSLCPLCHPHALCPQVPCSLLSFPTRAEPQFQVGPRWPPPSALCPPFLPQPQGRGTARASVHLQGPLPAQIPGAGPR